MGIGIGFFEIGIAMVLIGAVLTLFGKPNVFYVPGTIIAAIATIIPLFRNHGIGIVSLGGTVLVLAVAYCTIAVIDELVTRSIKKKAMSEGPALKSHMDDKERKLTQAKYWRKHGLCWHCGGYRGWFSKNCKFCSKLLDYEICPLCSDFVDTSYDTTRKADFRRLYANPIVTTTKTEKCRTCHTYF